MGNTSLTNLQNNFYTAVMPYGVGLLIFGRKKRVETLIQTGEKSAPARRKMVIVVWQTGSYLFLLFVKTYFITYYLLSIIPYSFYQRFLFQITA